MTTAPATPPPTRHLIAPYRPLAWQIAPWRDTSPTIVLTGSAGGGKSRLAAEKIHGYALKYPRSTVLVVRKARNSITNSTAEFLRQEIIGDDPRVRHVSTKSRFEYTNRSLLIYAGLENEDQRERLRSIGARGGVDIAWMEEATEFEEADFNAVGGRMRGRAAPWRQIILTCNPDAPTHWIYRRLIVAGEARIYYSSATDNPYNPVDYLVRLDGLTGVDGDRLARGLWVQATGLILDTWRDGPDDGNVTEAAEYVAGGGRVVWSVDDGYVGKRDKATGQWTAESHPRSFGLYQIRHDGTICRFAEDVQAGMLSDAHLREVLALPYPPPEFAVVDKSAAELKGRLHAAGIYTRNSPADVEESIKELRRALALDAKGRRRVLVHPRCRDLRAEMVSYRRDGQGRIIKAFDHTIDELRYLVWALRYEE